MQVEPNCLNLYKIWDLNVKKNHCMRQFCGCINMWYTNWPHLMKLWKKLLVIPSSIAICERVFSKQILSRAICEFHWAWTLWILWCEYHYVGYNWRIWIGWLYLSYGATWGTEEFLVWTNIVRSSNYSTFLFESILYVLIFDFV